MELKTAESYRNDIPVIEVSGRLDAVTSEGFQELLLSKIKETQGDLILECSGLEFVSSAGLRAFLTAQKTLQASGGHLRLVNVKDVIMKVLVMTGFDKYLKVEP